MMNEKEMMQGKNIPVNDAGCCPPPKGMETVKELAFQLRRVAEEIDNAASIVRREVAGAVPDENAKKDKEILCLSDSLEDTLEVLRGAFGQLCYTVERLG